MEVSEVELYEIARLLDIYELFVVPIEKPLE